jgi:hypothetical protein
MTEAADIFAAPYEKDIVNLYSGVYAEICLI